MLEAGRATLHNAELIDRLFTLSNRCAIGDAQAMSELIAHYHAGAEVGAGLDAAASAGEAPEDLIRSYFDQVGRTCYVWYAYADELQEHGDLVLALGGIRSVERETHDDRETAVGWVFEVRESKVSAVRAYSSYADATAAVRDGSRSPAG